MPSRVIPAKERVKKSADGAKTFPLPGGEGWGGVMRYAFKGITPHPDRKRSGLSHPISACGYGTA